MTEDAKQDACVVCKAPEASQVPWPPGKSRDRSTCPVVPLCAEHARRLRYGDAEVVRKLVTAAPAHWKETREWENAREHFEAWVARRRTPEVHRGAGRA